MCVIHIKLSKLKGRLTPPLPSLIPSPSPSLSYHWAAFCFSSHAETHTCIRAYVRAYVRTLAGSFLYFFFPREAAARAPFVMFCNSSVALGCKTHLCAAVRGTAGYLIWCEKGWWMLFACCIDVQTAVWMLPQQGRTVIVWLASKQVYQMISALAYLTVLGETHTQVCTIKSSLSSRSTSASVRLAVTCCVRAPRPRVFMAATRQVPHIAVVKKEEKKKGL